MKQYSTRQSTTIKRQLSNTWRSYQYWLRFLIIIFIALGVTFRFANLGQKHYWNDEAVVSLRSSGYTETELFQQVYDGRIVSIQDLQKYQSPAPEKGVRDIITSLAVEEPQSPPLYYLIARLWMQWVGSSVVGMRSLSAFISLLALPCIYWLCRELFESAVHRLEKAVPAADRILRSQLTGWIAVALVAVSPFHLLYAQEARMYSLWTVMILLSSAVFLRAMRVNTKLSWGAYAVSLIISLYTFPFSGFVAIAHGIYTVFLEGFRFSKKLTSYLLASIIGLIAYAPWLYFIALNSHKMSPFRATEVPFHALAASWNGHIRSVFFDFSPSIKDAIRGMMRGNLFSYIYIFLALSIIVVISYSFYFLYQKTPKKVWLFIFLLVGTTALALLIPDLILGGQRSIIARYVIPFFFRNSASCCLLTGYSN